MRRSGSSSCMLRPKNSFSAEDLQRLALENHHQMKLSTTVLTVNKLPNYCTDRLYMLSELQVHSNSIDFLCDLNNNNNNGNSSVGSADNTVSTEEEEDEDNDKEVQDVRLPPSIILYLLWKPNTYPTPQSFVDGPLSESVKQCLLANGDEVNDQQTNSHDVSPKTPPYNNSASAPNSPIRRQQLSVGAVSFDKLKRDTLQDDWGNNSADISRSKRASIEETNQKQMTKIYVVVDRISPSETTATDTDAVDDGIGELPDFSIGSSSFDQTDYSTSTAAVNSSIQNHSQSQQHTSNEMTSQHNNEIKMAEKLAKSVSSNKFLRGSVDGISIGITSDARAAPGLEACMDAVCRGSKERRKAVRDYRLKKKSSVISSSSSREEQAMQHLRDKSPERSPVAIVAMQPDDLECTDNDHHSHSHHHHHSEEVEVSPNILQCRVATEWNGLGECNTFTDRAMQDWRKAWNVSDVSSDVQNGMKGSSSGNHSGRAVRPKVPRINRRKELDNGYDDDEKYADEPISTVMITVLLVGIVAYGWNLYGDIIMRIFFGDDGVLNPPKR